MKTTITIEKLTITTDTGPISAETVAAWVRAIVEAIRGEES